MFALVNVWTVCLFFVLSWRCCILTRCDFISSLLPSGIRWSDQSLFAAAFRSLHVCGSLINHEAGPYLPFLWRAVSFRDLLSPSSCSRIQSTLNIVFSHFINTDTPRAVLLYAADGPHLTCLRVHLIDFTFVCQSECLLKNHFFPPSLVFLWKDLFISFKLRALETASWEGATRRACTVCL